MSFFQTGLLMGPQPIKQTVIILTSFKPVSAIRDPYAQVHLVLCETVVTTPFIHQIIVRNFAGFWMLVQEDRTLFGFEQEYTYLKLDGTFWISRWFRTAPQGPYCALGRAISLDERRTKISYRLRSKQGFPSLVPTGK